MIKLFLQEFNNLHFNNNLQSCSKLYAIWYKSTFQVKFILKWHNAQFSLQNLVCSCYIFQNIAINNDNWQLSSKIKE